MDLSKSLNTLTNFTFRKLKSFMVDRHISKQLLCRRITDIAHPVILLYDNSHPITMVYCMMLINNIYSLELPLERLRNKVKATVTVKDIEFCYEVNNYYFEIDCEPWTNMECKIIPDLVQSLVSHKPLQNGKHVVLLRNINVLNPLQMQRLKSVIERNSSICTVIATTRKFSYTTCLLKGFCLPIFIKFNVLEFCSELLIESGKCYDQGTVLRTLCNVNQDPCQCFFLLHAEEKEDVISHYIQQSVKLMMMQNDNGLYKCVSDTVNNLVSSDVPINDIFRGILQYLASHGCMDKALPCATVLTDLAYADTLICTQNKINFGLEQCFITLVNNLKLWEK